MPNNDLSIILVIAGIILIAAAVIVVATLPPEVEPPLGFISDYFTRMVIAIVLVAIGIILIIAGLYFR